MYCVPLDYSDKIDFGNMVITDFENVKLKCDAYPSCKAFYEVSQNGEKNYFGCKNRYEMKRSSYSDTSHILYLKGIDNFSKRH